MSPKCFVKAVLVVLLLASAAEAQQVVSLIPLDIVVEGEPDATFDNGQEFPGAKGSLSVVQDLPEKGQACLKLAGDFTKGGAYVQIIKDLKSLEINDLAAIRLRVKAEHAGTVTVRLGDGTGQCHQQKGVKLQDDGKWHDLVIKPSEVAGGEHWGGANDGKWHGSPKYLAVLLSADAGDKGKLPVLYLANVGIDAIQPAVVQAATFKADFERSDKLPGGWIIQGKVVVDNKEAFKGKHSLLFERGATRGRSVLGGQSHVPSGGGDVGDRFRGQVGPGLARLFLPGDCNAGMDGRFGESGGLRLAGGTIQAAELAGGQQTAPDARGRGRGAVPGGIAEDLGKILGR